MLEVALLGSQQAKIKGGGLVGIHLNWTLSDQIQN